MDSIGWHFNVDRCLALILNEEEHQLNVEAEWCAESLKPIGKRLKPAERRGEAARVLLALPAALGRQAHGCHHAVAVYIETGAALNENVHSLLLPGGDKLPSGGAS